MAYLITDLKKVESDVRIKADSGTDTLEELAVSGGFLNLAEFASARLAFIDDLMAAQLQ